MIRGRKVIAEARELLSEMRFSPNRGDFREKKHLSILIDPRYDPATQTISALVTCHPFGSMTVDWDGYVIVTVQLDRESLISSFAFIDQRGQAVLGSLPPGSFSLSLEPYDENLWTKCAIVPADQVARQHWIRPSSAEKVCNLLESCVSDASRPVSFRQNKLDILKSFIHAEPFVRPAAVSCLEIMCRHSVPPELRLSAAQCIPPSAARIAGGVDLARFAKRLSDADKMKEEHVQLEKSLCSSFGSILAARKTTADDEIQILTALIARNSAPEFDFYRSTAIRTKGRVPTGPREKGVRTRGAVTGVRSLNPLVDLARAGGRRVRDELIRQLKKRPANDNLIRQLLSLA
jgi:hypothetical protein